MSSIRLLDLFDRLASSRIPDDTDIFVALSSCAEYSLCRAKSLGAVTVVERMSTHIDAQDALLKEEFERQGVPYLTVIDPAIRDKEKREYKIADWISVPSSHVEKSFIAQGVPAAKIIRVPFGVDLDHFAPGKKQDDIFRVVHFGTLSIRKGIPYLLRAFCELRIPNAELWLVGSILDEIKPFLKQYASPAIKLMGPFPEFTLQDYYAQGSVFCLMSIEEGMAQTLLMAMACGLPIICTTQTGGEDVVRDGIDGFLLQPRDVDSLKEKILFFYEHPEAQSTMGAAARENIVSNYTWQHYGQRMLNVYQDIFSRRHSSSHS